MTIKHYFQGAVFCLALVSISVTLTVILSPAIYWFFTGALDLGVQMGLSHDQVNETYRYIIAFLLDPRPGAFSLPYFSFSLEGAIHFQDVKFLVQGNGLISLLGLSYALYFLRTTYQPLAKYKQAHLRRIGIWLPILALLVGVFFFDFLFLAFHQIAFSNSFWIFDPLRDPVIHVLPELFFLVLFVVSVLIYEFCLWIFHLAYSK